MLRLVLEFILDMALYATGRLVIRVISLGRIKVTPLREPIGRARVTPTRSTDDVVAGYGSCSFVGFVFWASVILMLAHSFGRPA